MLADAAVNRKHTDRALQYSERVISVLGKHAKPDGMSAADWERKRATALGRSRWIAGIAHSEKNQYFEAVPPAARNTHSKVKALMRPKTAVPGPSERSMVYCFPSIAPVKLNGLISSPE